MNYFKPKSWKPLIIFLCVVFPIVAFCFFMIISGQATVTIKGFAVDPDNNLYIGKEHNIDVYKNKQIIKSIPIKYSNYAFTIDDGSEIMLSANNYTYHLDLQGNELIKEKDTQTYSKLCRINNYVADNGDTYRKSNLFGYTRIIRNNYETVYSTPIFDYVILLILVLTFLCIIIFIVIYLLKNLIYWVNNQN